MNKTIRRSASLLGTVGVALLLVSVSAQADSGPYWMTLAPGVGGPMSQDGGPGNEQLHSVATKDADGNVIVTTISMNSDTEGPYWQCKCSAVMIHKDGSGPELIADQVQLTNNGGNRPCNHPRVATDGKMLTWVYGTNAQNGNTRTYANVMTASCEEVVEDLRISNDNNQNEGAPDIAFATKMGDVTYFQAGYLSTGGNDRTYARQLMVDYSGGSPALSKGFLKAVITPANIGRPRIAVHPTLNRALICAPKGDNRPPEDGGQCAYIDTMTGDILWKAYVAESDPANDKYINQLEVANAGLADQFFVQYLISTGNGKNSNIKGSTTQALALVEVSDQGMQIKSHIEGVGAYGSHSAMCSGRYGADGKVYAAVFDASITGIGAPGMQMVSYDPIAKELKAHTGMDNWAVSPYGDSGHLQNKYGANPNTQGRGFLRCAGNVENPAHGVEGAWMSDVKSFFIAPHTGRMAGEPKNAAILSLIPGEVDAPIQPPPPETSTTVGAGTGSGGGSATSSGAGASDSTGNGYNPDDPTFGTPEQSSGCSVTSASSHHYNGLILMALGLGFIGLARRRREV